MDLSELASNIEALFLTATLRAYHAFVEEKAFGRRDVRLTASLCFQDFHDEQQIQSSLFDRIPRMPDYCDWWTQTSEVGRVKGDTNPWCIRTFQPTRSE